MRNRASLRTELNKIKTIRISVLLTKALLITIMHKQLAEVQINNNQQT